MTKPIPKGGKIALIDDATVPRDLVQTLFEMGYCPYLVPEKKSWLTRKLDGTNLQWGHGKDDPDVSSLLSVLNETPHFGVGFSVRRFQTRDFFPYYVDIDIFDPDALADIRALLPPGAVSWRGAKAGALLFRRPSDTTLLNKVYALDKRSPSPLMGGRGGTGHSIKVPRYVSHPRHSGVEGRVRTPQIEFLSEKDESHSILPPTLHVGSLEDYNEMVRYEWIEGQPTHLDTSPDKLPWIRDFHLLILYEWCRNPDSAGVEFFRSARSGNFHDILVAATQHLAHEGWEPEDIESAILDKVRRFDDAADESKMRERETEVTLAVRGAKKRVEKKGGVDPSKPVGSKGIPLERQIVDFLSEAFEEDDTRVYLGDLFHWSEGTWTSLTDPTHKTPMRRVLRMIEKAYPTAKDRDIVAGAKIWERGVEVHPSAHSPHTLAFQNGVYDIRTGKLRPEEREDYAFGHMKVRYREDAEAPRWKEFLRHLCKPPRDLLGSEQYTQDWDRAEQMLEEYLGYSLFANLEFRHLLYLVGSTSTGKTTMALVMRGLMPEGWVSEVALDALEDAPSRYSMRHSRLNIGSEIGRRSRNIDDLLLQISSGEGVQIKKLYENPIQVVLPTRMMFHGNQMPESADAHGALMRRMLLIRTTSEAPAVSINRYHEVLLEESEGIVRSLIRAYARLVERSEFIKPQYHEEAEELQREGSNSVQMWLASGRVVPTEDRKETTSSEELYLAYKDWCEMFYPGRALNLYQWGGKATEAGFPAKTLRFPSGRVRLRYLKLIEGRMESKM